MAQKNTGEQELKGLRSKIQEGKVLIGADRVLKQLRSRRLLKVFLARNCPQHVREDLLQFARLSSVPVVELEQNNEELGVLCKKNFFVSAIGVLE